MCEPGGQPWAATQLSSGTYRVPQGQLVGDFDSPTGDQARMAYARSAETVRAMIEQAGALAVVALVQDIGRGDTFEVAFERRMSTSYNSFSASVDPAR